MDRNGRVLASARPVLLAMAWALAVPGAAFGILLSSETARAAPVVDGVKDAQYGAALAVQTVQTQFGDNLSELDAAYATSSGGVLHLMLTGNIEANFNNVEIFIDSKAGGQNVFSSAGNAGASKMDGLQFDAGFTADYHLIARRGNFGGDFGLVGCLVREHRSTGEITNRENVRNIGLHVFVDRNDAAIVYGNTGFLGVELIAVGAATY